MIGEVTDEPALKLDSLDLHPRSHANWPHIHGLLVVEFVLLADVPLKEVSVGIVPLAEVKGQDSCVLGDFGVVDIVLLELLHDREDFIDEPLVHKQEGHRLFDWVQVQRLHH